MGEPNKWMLAAWIAVLIGIGLAAIGLTGLAINLVL
jgi:hypothetical protein